jgi:putative FmdB family regulatory protein
MPTYEFECHKCKKKFSLVLSLSEYENKKPKCPKCGSKQVEQLIQPFFAITSKKS